MTSKRECSLQKKKSIAGPFRSAFAMDLNYHKFLTHLLYCKLNYLSLIRNYLLQQPFEIKKTHHLLARKSF